MPTLAIVPTRDECGIKTDPCQCDICVNTARAKRDIDHGCDGPITAFVLISRACRLAEKRKYDFEAVANALHEALTDYGWVRDEMIETDS